MPNRRRGCRQTGERPKSLLELKTFEAVKFTATAVPKETVETGIFSIETQDGERFFSRFQIMLNQTRSG